MTDLYRTNDKELNDLQNRLDGLHAQMAEYLSNIQLNADRYRQCTS